MSAGSRGQTPMKKTPPLSSTLHTMFSKLFARDALLALARKCGAVERLREIHPADVCCALLAAAFGDEKRSIATARREYGRLSGTSVEESSFYERFTPGLNALMRTLLQRALESVDA